MDVEIMLYYIVPKNSEFPSLFQLSLTVRIHLKYLWLAFFFVEEQHTCHFTGPRHIEKNCKFNKIFSLFLNIIFIMFWFFYPTINYKWWRTNVLFICLQKKRYTHECLTAREDTIQDLKLFLFPFKQNLYLHFTTIFYRNVDKQNFYVCFVITGHWPQQN